MSEPSLDEQIACVEHEIEMRERMYPRWIAAGRLKAPRAERALAGMKAVRESLYRLKGLEK